MLSKILLNIIKMQLRTLLLLSNGYEALYLYVTNTAVVSADVKQTT